MKIGILGAGAMGCLVGAHLKIGGAAVHLIDVNKEHMAAIEENGLHMEIEAGPDHGAYSRAVRFDSATCDSRSIGVCDAVIILVKCYSTHDAIVSNLSLFGEKTAVVTLQNGVGTQELLKEHFSDDNIGFGLMKASALQYAPGRIYGRPRFPDSPKGIYYRSAEDGHPVSGKFSCSGEISQRGWDAHAVRRNWRRHVWESFITTACLTASARCSASRTG